MNKKLNGKVTLYFDSTTRNGIDRGWPSLILKVCSPPNVSNKFTIRPLIFTFEDRQYISKLIIKTLYRLSVTFGTTQKIIWELIDGLITDNLSQTFNYWRVEIRSYSSSLYLQCSHFQKILQGIVVSFHISWERNIAQRRIRTFLSTIKGILLRKKKYSWMYSWCTLQIY